MLLNVKHHIFQRMKKKQFFLLLLSDLTQHSHQDERTGSGLMENHKSRNKKFVYVPETVNDEEEDTVRR